MTFLRDVTDRFWSYVSPRKTQQRRDKPFKVPALPSHVNRPHQKPTTTPRTRDLETRIKTWHTRTPSPQSDGEDIDATLLPPSPPTSAGPSHDDLEGETLLSGSPGAPAGYKIMSADEVDANEDTILVDDGAYMNQNMQVDVDEERRRRHKQGRELRDAGWSEDAVFLFQKLGMRGFEPLLPIDWIDDFETLPEDLFTAKLDRAFIKPSLGPDYHAQLALSNLFDLGSVTRDAWHTRAPKRTPAYHIRRAVQKYTKWAMKDGEIDNIWSALPLFEIATWGREVHSSEGERKMAQKLSNLHARWQEALKLQTEAGTTSSAVPEVPTLYGVTASHTVMAFVSYAPPTEENQTEQLRLIAMFDFGKEGFDVWNSLAVAIFVIHCRNRITQLKESLPEPELPSEEDPDI